MGMLRSVAGASSKRRRRPRRSSVRCRRARTRTRFFCFHPGNALSTIGLQSDLKYLTRLGTLGIRLIRRFSAPPAQVKLTFLVGLPVELHLLEGPE